MSWPVVAVLLAGCAGLGALVGRTLTRVGTDVLLCSLAVACALLFVPGDCTRVLTAPSGYPALVQDGSTCDTLYGIRLPELPGTGEDATGGVLALTGSTLAGAALVHVRRTQRSAHRRTSPRP
jgi:LPXTG-motif cell wall-anchored protein